MKNTRNETLEKNGREKKTPHKKYKKNQKNVFL